MDKATQERKVWGDYRGHEAKECESCKQWFFPPFETAVVCYPCWRRSQGDSSEVAKLQARIRELEAELAEERENAEELFDYWREAAEEVEGIKKRLSNQSQGIPGDMLRRLLHLCHPDKHQGSEAATIATRWLLEQREGGRHG